MFSINFSGIKCFIISITINTPVFVIQFWKLLTKCTYSLHICIIKLAFTHFIFRRNIERLITVCFGSLSYKIYMLKYVQIIVSFHSFIAQICFTFKFSKLQWSQYITPISGTTAVKVCFADISVMYLTHKAYSVAELQFRIVTKKIWIYSNLFWRYFIMFTLLS